MRGLVEKIQAKNWPALFLVCLFLLMTVLVVPADSEINARVQPTAIVQYDQNSTLANSAPDYYNASRATASRTAAIATSAVNHSESGNFTVILSLILLMVTIVNARLFWKINTKN